jgi:hypothetical protein
MDPFLFRKEKCSTKRKENITVKGKWLKKGKTGKS